MLQIVVNFGCVRKSSAMLLVLGFSTMYAGVWTLSDL